MSELNYIPNAKTAEEHLNNCAFQLANVQGWLGAGVRDCAAIKTECLLQDVKLLHAAFEAEARAKRKQEAA